MAKIDEYDAIEKVIKQYIEGAAKGDIKLLAPIFDEKARLFGEGPPKGKRYDLDRDAYFKDQAAMPLDPPPGGKYRARLVSVQQIGPSAIAIVEEDGCWGPQNVSFVNQFFDVEDWRPMEDCEQDLYVDRRRGLGGPTTGFVFK